jgi:hypothetical protein
MTVEQVISIIAVVVCGFFAVDRDDVTLGRAIRQLCFGAAFIVLQLILNKAIGGNMLGEEVPPEHVLLLREISFNVAFAFLGYILVCAGLIGIARSSLGNAKREDEFTDPN